MPRGLLGPIDLRDPLVREHPLNRGLVAKWLCLPGLDGGNRWFDVCGLNHGTLTNMTTAGTSGWGPTTRPGGFGEMRFDGTDDSIATTASISGLSVCTTSMWAKRATTQRMEITQGDNSFGRYTFGPAEDGNIYVVPAALTAYASIANPVNSSGGLDMYTMVFDGTQTGNADRVRFWVNGIERTPLIFVGIIPATIGTFSQNLGFGMRYPSGGYSTGSMDSAPIYNRALSSAEILWLYNEERTGHRETIRRVWTPSPRSGLFVPRRTLYKSTSRSI